jgi:hypothetical protein
MDPDPPEKKGRHSKTRILQSRPESHDFFSPKQLIAFYFLPNQQSGLFDKKIGKDVSCPFFRFRHFLSHYLCNLFILFKLAQSNKIGPSSESSVQKSGGVWRRSKIQPSAQREEIEGSAGGSPVYS